MVARLPGKAVVDVMRGLRSAKGVQAIESKCVRPRRSTVSGCLMFGRKQLENQGILPLDRQWRIREGSRRKMLNLRLDMLGFSMPMGDSSESTNGAPRHPDI